MFRVRKFVSSGVIAVCCVTSAISWSAASAATLVVEYDDGKVSAKGAAWGNVTLLGIWPPPPDPDQEFVLPRFDPALGTLISVELETQLFLQGNLSTHCNFAGYCWAEATGSVHDSLDFDPVSYQLGVDLGTPLDIDFDLSVACDDFGFAASCIDSTVRSLFKTRDFSFTGSEAAPFVGVLPIKFDDAFDGVYISGIHTGFPADSTLETAADDGGEAIHLAALINFIRKETSTDPMHTGAYNHAHIEGYSMAHALVRYTYEPFAAAVPEPATWAMMIAGFGLIGGTMRRKAREAVA